MFKVMIVDDEKPVLDGITKIINRHFPDLDVVATAQSGRNAIEKAQENHPDLVLMDVNLPGISGLDAMRAIRDGAPETLFVLITAYERFDIAKEAFELGVSDYLLKPVIKENLLGMLEKALGILRGRKQSLLIEVRQNEKDTIAKRYLTMELFNHLQRESCLDPLDFSERLNELCLALELVDGLYAVVLVDGFQSSNSMQAFCTALGYKHRILHAVLDSNRLGLLVFGTCEQISTANLEKDVLACVNSVVGTTNILQFSVGNPQGLDAIALSYRGAKLGLLSGKLRGQGTTWKFDQDILTGIVYRPLNSFYATVQTYLHYLDGLEGEDRRRSAIRTASFIFHSLISLRQDLLPRLTFPEALWDEDTMAHRATMEVWLLDLAQTWAGLQDGRHSPVVEKALSFLKNNWHIPVSLEDVASFAEVSPQYLSRLFSEEMHITFVDYLTTIRMEQARALLSQGKSIKIVARELGYSDPNYFGRLFKKMCGVPPSDFARTFR